MPGILSMKSRLTQLAWSATVVALLTQPASAVNVPRAEMAASHRLLLEQHCFGCHNAETQEGSVRLDNLPLSIADIQTAERWQKVLNVLNAGEMPPEAEPQPDTAAKTDFLDALSNVMVVARQSLADAGGRGVIRRLNRREYSNTLRELLGVEINVAELPADTSNGAFDTVGANLFMSESQVEQYLALGRTALDEAFEWQAAMGLEQKIRVEAEEASSLVRKKYEDELDALERARNWVAAVEAAMAKPENAAVVAELRKDAKNDDAVRLQWRKIQGAPAPEDFGFVTKQNSADLAHYHLSFGTPAAKGYMRAYREAYLDMPDLDRGAYLTIGGNTEMLLHDHITLVLPFAWKTIPGDYMFRVRLAATDKATPERKFIEFGVAPKHTESPFLSTHRVTGTMDNPQIIEIPITLTRRHAERDNRTLFIREKGIRDHYSQAKAIFGAAKTKNGIGPEFAIWVDWIELERLPDSRKGEAPGIAALGIPLDDKAAPASADVRGAIERFCVEAFRGAKPDSAYLDKLTRLYDTRREAGDKHTAALKRALSVALASPQFLYLAEPVQDSERRPLSAAEFATRLSYFLWGGPPDATLRDLAARGELMKPEVLAEQTTRLLDSPRSQGFTRPFVHQWLQLDRLDFFEFNRELFPRFDKSTKLAAREEIFATFEHILHENASARDLLQSDYAIISPLLADYYGIAGVEGDAFQVDAFQKVSLPKDSVRGGLLGMAAVMAMGGNGSDTSPVERGAWVLRKLLNDPPPPAPANIPQITRLAGQVLTTRERLTAHQQDAQCANCHRKIDPLGFGLENFDAVGQWRTEDTYQVMDETGKPVKGASKTWEIDAAGQIHRGPAFKDYFELRDIITSRADAFARGFSMALIEYGLGRPAGLADYTLADEMLSRAKDKNLAIREFIHALVASKEFHTK
jgi:mono/diheme cytochrome c family protein